MTTTGADKNLTFGDAQRSLARARRLEAKGLFGSASSEFFFASRALRNIGKALEADAALEMSRTLYAESKI